ncbi:hypothetical protein FHX49_000646 [Microbacterium endophyticum]|uniref:Uncharacterized protein n=1 Tax=Microbacterium endophyticum TaxID=1526412 RepID=A0A7W4V1H4_9MICO|nr:hypothetical protein [Microbacterium endophyticum]MBB2975105.1 hypothetical protein [Microbacterium endophyticum]
MPKGNQVQRPTKKSEYTIVFASTGAEKGWRDLRATTLGPLADSWDFLTRTPTERTPTNYPLKGELGVVSRGGKTYMRWQHKPTRQGDARIWFYVDGQTVYLEQVHTTHPNQTK